LGIDLNDVRSIISDRIKDFVRQIRQFQFSNREFVKGVLMLIVVILVALAWVVYKYFISYERDTRKTFVATSFPGPVVMLGTVSEYTRCDGGGVALTHMLIGAVAKSCQTPGQIMWSSKCDVVM
jgi:hypothetical protein